MNISTRDYFASTADVTWMRTATAEEAELKTGVKAPDTLTTEKTVKFWTRVEIAWRWIYADLMLDGFKASEIRIQQIPKERAKNEKL